MVGTNFSNDAIMSKTITNDRPLLIMKYLCVVVLRTQHHERQQHRLEKRQHKRGGGGVINHVGQNKHGRPTRKVVRRLLMKAKNKQTAQTKSKIHRNKYFDLMHKQNSNVLTVRRYDARHQIIGLVLHFFLEKKYTVNHT